MNTKDELEEQRSEVASDLSVWRSFIEHAGWKMLQEAQQEQMEVRKSVVMSTCLNPDSNVYAQEFIKGQFSGIEQLLRYPEDKIEEAKRLLTVLDVKLENHYETEAARKPAESRVDTDEHWRHRQREK